MPIRGPMCFIVERTMLERFKNESKKFVWNSTTNIFSYMFIWFPLHKSIKAEVKVINAWRIYNLKNNTAILPKKNAS